MNIIRQIYILLFCELDFSISEQSDLLLLKSMLEADHRREVENVPCILLLDSDGRISFG